MLLITFEYDQNQMSGSPFAVLEPELNELYHGTFQLDRLGTAEALASYPRFRERGLTYLTERVYRLTRVGAKR